MSAQNLEIFVMAVLAILSLGLPYYFFYMRDQRYSKKIGVILEALGFHRVSESSFFDFNVLYGPCGAIYRRGEVDAVVGVRASGGFVQSPFVGLIGRLSGGKLRDFFVIEDSAYQMYGYRLGARSKNELEGFRLYGNVEAASRIVPVLSGLCRDGVAFEVSRGLVILVGYQGKTVSVDCIEALIDRFNRLSGLHG